METENTSRYIKLFDKIKQWQHYQEPSVFLVFIDLLLSANFRDTWYKGHKVKRGEAITSVAKICESTGLSHMTVKDALKKLESTNEIKKESFNKFSKITINQFSTYQGELNISYQGSQQGSYQGSQQGSHIQEYIEREERKEREEYIPPVPPLTDGKNVFGIFQNVFLSESDIEKVKMQISYRGLDCEKYFEKVIDKYSAYKQQTGKRYQNDAAACINFGISAVLEEEQRTKPQGQQQKSKSEKLDEAYEKTKQILGLNEEDEK